jgi:hypothetical protein
MVDASFEDFLAHFSPEEKGNVVAMLLNIRVYSQMCQLRQLY